MFRGDAERLPVRDCPAEDECRRIETINVEYLLGVATGGFWIGRLVDRLRAPSITYQYLQLGVAGIALLGIALFGSLPGLALFGLATLRTSSWSIALVDGLLAAIIIVPPTILIGASLPLAAQLLGGNVPRRGRELGTALAWVASPTASRSSSEGSAAIAASTRSSSHASHFFMIARFFSIIGSSA